LTGFLALYSQHWWERRRAALRAEGGEYIRFDLPVGVTLVSLVVPAFLESRYPEIPFLWWFWIAGGLLVVIPSVLVRMRRRN